MWRTVSAFFYNIIITQALYISIWCVWGQVLCVCVPCVLLQLNLSPVERQVFRQVLSALLRLWTVTHSGGSSSDTSESPSMWQWMLTSADSTLLHFQLIAASVAPLWKDFHLSQTCVCVCSKGPTGWILSLCAALTEQNYYPVWSHIQNYSGNIQYAELTGGGSSMNCAVASVGLDLAHQTSFINWFKRWNLWLFAVCGIHTPINWSCS